MRYFFLYAITGLALLSCAGQSESPDARAVRLGRQVRCPVCRGVSIAESPSALAQEMMGLVRGKIAEGRSDAEILNFFEERYGQWALLKPRAEGMNLVVWILPVLMVIGGAVVIIIRTGRSRGVKEERS